MRSRSLPKSLLSASVVAALTCTVAVPVAHAASGSSDFAGLSSRGTSSSSGSSSSSSKSKSKSSTSKETTQKRKWVEVKPPKKTASAPVRMPNGTTVQIMGDVLGPYSAHTGFRSGDLGVMAPVGTNGEFAMIFGDSFRGNFGDDWMSPVGVIAKMDENGYIEIVRPIDNSYRVDDMISYHHVNNLTLIPSDVINIDGTLYMQGMWNQGIGNVSGVQIWRSTDNGATWTSIASTGSDFLGGMGQLISWEKGPDGYIYTVATSFKRADPVYLMRFKPQDIGNMGKWQVYSPKKDKWGSSAEPILDDVRAGEMNLRYIDGHWVLVMFNQKTLSIEVRISDTLDQDWSTVPVAVIAQNGPWSTRQTPENWSQPYGGYIVPGSTIDNMDIVVSQWKTDDNSRYMSTQFNVKGLDKFFGINTKKEEKQEVLKVVEHAATDTPDMQAEDAAVEARPEVFAPDDNDGTAPLRVAAIVLGLVSSAVALPLIQQQLRDLLQL